MKRALVAVTTALASVVALAAPAHGATFTVTVGGVASPMMFDPSSLTITVGDTVNFVWGSSSHSTTSGTCAGGVCTASPGWDSGVQSSPFTFPVVFSSTGTFPYFCAVHGPMGMTGTITVNPAVAVRVRSLSASTAGRGVRVRWRAESALGTAGFNVYRELSGRRTKANRSLIPVRGASPTRARAYTFVDRDAPHRGHRLRYWLQALDLAGAKSWYGPAAVARP